MLTIEECLEGDGCVVCSVEGELDMFTATQLRNGLACLAMSRRLVIDLSGVPSVDSSGLSALVGGIRRVREHGGDVVVACSRRVGWKHTTNGGGDAWTHRETGSR